ncbi:MAG: 2-amino-4-hydroxy-6-hydroxymethyldihydropteridine diphosphokinase [Actinobacteria bacterium]|nr:2-amino-4-hydroxy-6-hydroxymethyldihydropteridine diphosphokinase [Actinomycetota bacterium]
MSRAVLSIGSNLGDRLGNLQGAVDGLGGAVVAVSSVYRSTPWGPVTQGDFLNAVLVVADSGAGPWDWLARAHRAEDAAGRVRDVHWGPRTLDVDVIVVDEVRSADPALRLPHPHAHERAFVLLPWLEVEPDAVLPGLGRVADLAAVLDGSTVRRLDRPLRWGEPR